jgi:hypothetical protein
VTLEANFAMAGMGMEPLQLDRDMCLAHGRFRQSCRDGGLRHIAS